MSTIKKAVYFFCTDSNIDPVAGRVLKALSGFCRLDETEIVIDSQPVRRIVDEAGNIYYFVSTNKVVCHDYMHYLPIMQQYFTDFDFAGLVTWHEGPNAPDEIFSIHTTGDVESGYFGNANPQCMHNLLWSLEQSRLHKNLSNFRVTTEATHWSGIIYHGGSPDLIPQFPVPLVDIEIGSTPRSWADCSAANVIANTLTSVFCNQRISMRNILCVGGVHFEQAFADAAFQTWGNHVFGISHIIPNHWLVSGQYEVENGLMKLENCIQSIQGGITGIAYHDNLKGIYKDLLRYLGQKHDIPVFKHQLLRRPMEIHWREKN
jgi:D-tyrosyl-tRNA(Tyr) deacylase